MKYFNLIFTGIVIFSSCNNDTKKAQLILNEATSFYNAGQLNNAKTYIDSLRSSYPKEFDLIRESMKLMWKIELKENEKNYSYSDSLLKIKIPEADILKKSFDYVSSDYETNGAYIFKGMSVERNIERSYLRSGVYETGDIYLNSVYFGKGNINHTGMTLEIPGTELSVSTSTIPYDGGTNYRFSDGGNNSEIITYKKGKDNGVLSFIADNQDKKIKVIYTGQRKYNFILDKIAQNSIAKSYELAVILTDIHRLRQERDIAESKITYLKKKIQE